MSFFKTFFCCGVLCLSISACVSAGNTRSPSSEWKNILACDEGLRIDERSDFSHQIVLFGKAAEHFITYGAISRNDLNKNAEYVRFLQTEHDSFVAPLMNGLLKMPNQIVGSQGFVVQWRPYSNASDQHTEFIFRSCH